MPIFIKTHLSFLFPALQRATLASCALVMGACARPASHYAVDALLSSAYRPTRIESSGSFQILAGDLHCHVTPPDAPIHVSRGIEETITLAQNEQLDFVVLTPHVRAQFFLDQQSREQTVHALSNLEREVARYDHPKTRFFVGFEYTDFAYGHVGAAFGNVQEVLANVSEDAAQKNPGAFFEAYVARGGLLFINHPLVTPLDSLIAMAQVDLSWRPLTEPGPYPDEIAAVDRLAHGFEAFNLTVTELRDPFLLFDTHFTLRRTMLRLDQEILSRGRRLVPVGGSDSHSNHLRATTFVLAENKSPSAIRDAFIKGRVCVRDPVACTFEAREAAGGPWMPIGSSLQNVEQVEVRAQGDVLDVAINGSEVRRGAPDKRLIVRVSKTHCSLIRARVDEGYSAPIYANCGF